MQDRTGPNGFERTLHISLHRRIVGNLKRSACVRALPNPWHGTFVEGISLVLTVLDRASLLARFTSERLVRRVLVASEQVLALPSALDVDVGLLTTLDAIGWLATARGTV